ncbi:MAG: hypothetical protein M0Z82_10105 [Actinomycetota bacterium]|nr:hypothetical protein [Actinomycetota bacterium]
MPEAWSPLTDRRRRSTVAADERRDDLVARLVPTTLGERCAAGTSERRGARRAPRGAPSHQIISFSPASPRPTGTGRAHRGRAHRGLRQGS